MESMREAADRLDGAASTLDSAYRKLVDLETATWIGADAPGRLGELHRSLRSQWTRVVEGHAREAASTAARLAGAAESLRIAASAYAETDRATAGRFRDR
ncbi:type VII secretion target [Catenuloplanes atrovinosus]|uniref:Uncharacterized protein n=1 Tax=Catenuloplanes atrovinosus TaxID=137266 RepID=A0AAE3YTL8_9ACTN|nr:type VII secretion target [Catenuloplanes atrovinosus]MDR7279649.1 hypothetical protein [Catenuloplanes atrovinosus]